MARLLDMVIDSHHPASLARFWAGALDGYEVAFYDADELARLRKIGIDDPEDDPTVLIVGPEGSPRIWCQAVPEPKSGKNRVHVDLVSDQPDVELARLVELGARVADQQSNPDLVVLHDPEGNELCLHRHPD